MNHARLLVPRREPGALSPMPGTAPASRATPETGVVPETIEQALDWAPTVEGPPVSERLAVIALVVLIAVGVVTLTLASTPARI
jgi:hypothetical protein